MDVGEPIQVFVPVAMSGADDADLSGAERQQPARAVGSSRSAVSKPGITAEQARAARCSRSIDRSSKNEVKEKAFAHSSSTRSRSSCGRASR